jgi:hypothetical protein
MEIGDRDRPPAILTIHFARRRDIGAIRVILKRELIKAAACRAFGGRGNALRCA